MDADPHPSPGTRGSSEPDVCAPPRARLVAGVLGGTAGVVAVLVVTRWSPLGRLDHRVADALHGLVVGNPAAVDVLEGATHAFDPWVFRVIAAVLATALALRGARRVALWLFLTVWCGGLVVLGLKLAVGRARPVLHDPVAHAGGQSFPSGHAFGSAAGCAVLLALAWPLLGRAGRAVAATVAVVVAVSTSFTRIALGVHFLSDVLAGALLGLAWVAVSLDLLVRTSGRQPGR